MAALLHQSCITPSLALASPKQNCCAPVVPQEPVEMSPLPIYIPHNRTLPTQQHIIIFPSLSCQFVSAAIRPKLRAHVGCQLGLSAVRSQDDSIDMTHQWVTSILDAEPWRVATQYQGRNFSLFTKVKKQRIYSLGTKSSSFITGTSCGSSATSQLHQDAMKEMVNQQLETMRVEMDAKLQAERVEIEAKLQAERAEMDAKLQAQMQTQMQAQIASLMDELRRNGIISTSMAQPQNT
nr:uncharacterized protein LOC109147304 [Ipomoea batatas]